MKSFAIAFAFCLVLAVSALTDEQKTKLGEHKVHCITETGVDSAKVEAAKTGTIDETDEKLGCFGSCLLKRIGIINANGTFNEEVTLSKIPADVLRDKAVELINKCKIMTGANDCETGLKMMKCYMENKTFSVLE